MCHRRDASTRQSRGLDRKEIERVGVRLGPVVAIVWGIWGCIVSTTPPAPTKRTTSIPHTSTGVGSALPQTPELCTCIAHNTIVAVYMLLEMFLFIVARSAHFFFAMGNRLSS